MHRPGQPTLFKLDRHTTTAGVELKALRCRLQAHDDAMLIFELHAAHTTTQSNRAIQAHISARKLGKIFQLIDLARGGNLGDTDVCTQAHATDFEFVRFALVSQLTTAYRAAYDKTELCFVDRYRARWSDGILC